MKRILFFAALVLGVVSCQKDHNGLNVDANGEAAVTISVALPEVETRAGGNDSAIGAFGNVDFSKYDVRYILEVYNLNGSLEGELAKERMVNYENDATSTSFSLRLIPGRGYRFVVWADLVEEGTKTDLHYVTTDLKDIQLKNLLWKLSDETRDAYTGIWDEETFNSTSNIRIELKRPLGKLRVVTTDIKDMFNVLPEEVTVKYISSFYTRFNAFTSQVVSDSKAYINNTINAKTIKISENKYTNEWNTEGKVKENLTLFADYYFAADDQEPISFTLDVKDNYGMDIPQVVFNTSIPIQRNHLTTIYGPILTDANNVTVTINDAFANEINKAPYYQEIWDGTSASEPKKDTEGNYIIEQPSELAWLADQVNGVTRAGGKNFKGETFILNNDIDLGGALWTPIGANSSIGEDTVFRGTFDGNGKTIANLVVRTEGKATAGLFANFRGVMKDLTIKNADIEGHYKVGVIAGEVVCGKVVDCHVDGARVYVTPYNNDDACHVGGIAGYLSADGGAASVENCSVNGAEIYAFRDVAGIVGTTTGSKNPTLKGNTVANTTITADQTQEYVNNNKDGNAGIFGGRQAAPSTIVDNTKGEGVVVKRYVDSAEELAYAVADAQNGDTIYIAGEVTMPYFTDKELNFEGINDKAIVKQSAASHIDAFYKGAGLNFKNVTLVGTSYTGSTQGYQKAAKETYVDCHFVNYIMFAGDVTTVTNCTFENEGQYFWTGTADTITFTECKFNGVERAVKVCTVGNNGERVVTFNDCEFTATAGKKAAIEIDGSKGSSYTVYINNCTETGFAKGEFTDMTMFNVEGAENVQVYLDGKKWVRNGVMEENGELFAYNAVGLQYLLDNAVDGETVKIGADIEGDVTVNQKADVKIAIEGNNHNFAGVILVDGKSATYTTAGVTIKNINFKADAISADAVIRLGKDNNSRYTCNVTVDSCTFDVPGAVGVKSYTGGDKNLTIKGCTATANAHSLVQAKGIDGILVEKCTVNSKNGMNFNNSTNVTVDQCTTDVKGYAVRYGESSGGVGAAEKYYISNSTLKSACEDGDAVVILRGTADYATLTITNTTLDGTIKVTNKAKDAKVIIDGKEMVEAASQSELNDIVAAGGDVAVTLADGNYSLPSVSNGNVAISGGKDVVITINKPNMTGSDITFTGVTVKGSGYATGVQHVNTVTYNNVTIDGEMCLYGVKNVFNECTFNLAAGQYIWTYGSDETEFNNCTFNTAGKAILVYNEGDGACKVKVDGCKFYATAAGYAGAIRNQACAAVEIDNFQSSGVGAAHTITTSNNTVGENFSGEWRIKNYVAGNPITVNGVEYTQIAIDGNLMTIDADKNISYM